MTYFAIRANGKKFDVLRVTRVAGQGPVGMTQDVVETAATFKDAQAAMRRHNGW